MKKTLVPVSALTLAAALILSVPATEASALPSQQLNLPAAFAPSVAYAMQDQAREATERQAAARVLAAKAKVPKWVTAINYADTKLGNPYRWGAEGPYYFDCSGLTMRAYQRAGVKMPRVANDQYRVSNVHPKKSQLAPGDLVFYSDRGDRDIHHVGIYVGSGHMIHAPRTGAVIRFDRINYMKGYYGATRIR